MTITRQDVTLPVESLKPYPANSRTHSDAQIAQIMRSIQEFGFTKPVLVDENDTILAGHGGTLAARKLGMKDVPCVRLVGLSDAQKSALVIADNKIAENAGWDKGILAKEITSLLDAGFATDVLGFKPAEINSLLSTVKVGLSDENAITPTPVHPVTAAGDVWVCGTHRVKCGSSTVATDVEDLLAGVKPHLMVTDPPYGVEYDPSWRNGLDKAKNRRTGAVENDDRADWREAWSLFPGNIAYVWHGGLHSREVQDSLEACDFKIRAQIIWVKNKMVFGRGDYHWQHEPCFYAVKGTGNWTGDRSQTTTWHIENLNVANAQAPENARTNHSTQKPVECMRRPIVNNSSPGQAVYEPFSGSGSTLIAAESTGRVCYAMELNPAYVDIAVKRWQDFTGKEAVHAITGEKFNDRVRKVAA